MNASPRLPDGIRACLFDLDGVLTQTARVHAAAWKEMFDQYLSDRARRVGGDLRPFSLPDDYARYVDGKLREDGVRAFLASRNIDLPDGSADDPPSAETVAGLATRKNELLLEMIDAGGVDVYASSVRFVEAVRDARLPRAVVSASKNCRAILEAAHIDHLFDARVDGVVAAQRNLRGKPAPDMFLAAAALLDVAPQHAAVFEDALAGVEAGRSGGFGCIVGVDRVDQTAALRSHGADIVVSDLGELLEDP
ncbi:MAG TPA: beta-phosphoglucomutase family hydrolase [Acidimicrobiia bacterium]|nr:beta-phosphoglucomutase family hydrolase [Acidimicrobiia bacterium]